MSVAEQRLSLAVAAAQLGSWTWDIASVECRGMVLVDSDGQPTGTTGVAIDVSGSMTEGFGRLRRAIARAPADPESLCDFVLDQLLEDRANADDVAIVAV